MNLQQFISETIQQIVRGATDAQINLGKHVRVNPTSSRDVSEYLDVKEYEDFQNVHDVVFDVQLVTEEGTETSGNAGFGIKVLSLSAKGQSNQSNQTSSRVQFTIPLIYDVDKLTSSSK